MAWIKTVAPEQASGALADRYAEATRRAGRVWNIVRLMSLRPDHIKASIEGLYVTLMHQATPGLTRAQRETIAIVVSQANRSEYFVEAHAEELRREVQDDALVEAIKRDYRSAGLDMRTRTMLDYCTKLTRRPSDCKEPDIRRLRQVGFDDSDILDIVQITGYVNYINRVADALGCDPEPAARAEAEVPKFRAPAAPTRRTQRPPPPAAKPVTPPAKRTPTLKPVAPSAPPSPAAPVPAPPPRETAPPVQAGPPPAHPTSSSAVQPAPPSAGPPVQIDASWYERPSDVPEEIAAGGVVVLVQGSRVFVALIKEGSLPGYVLPKGRARPNEDVLTAARREILEEAGIKDLRFLADLGTRERLSFSKGHWKTTHYFLFITTKPPGKPTDPNRGPVEWFPLDDLPPMPWREQQELLESSLQQIRWLISQQR